MKSMNFSDRQLRARWVRPFRFLHLLIDSALSFLTRVPRGEDLEAIKRYFRPRYLGKSDRTVMDGKTGAYLSQVLDVSDDLDFSDRPILEMCCGDGSFFRFLSETTSADFDYTGIDLAHPETRLTSSARIVSSSVYEANRPSCQPHLLVAINGLCFLKDLDRVEYLARPKPGDVFIVIEPVPSLFWNRHFDGIKLFYRSQTELARDLASFGWRPTHLAKYSLIILGNKPVWQLCYASRFSA